MYQLQAAALHALTDCACAQRAPGDAWAAKQKADLAAGQSCMLLPSHLAECQLLDDLQSGPVPEDVASAITSQKLWGQQERE